MPVDVSLDQDGMIYQREQYSKGGIGVRYWNYRDKSAFKYVQGAKIADIGCGEGITLENLIKIFPDKEIIGIDAESQNVEICNNHNLPVHSGSVYELPAEDNQFDTVLFLEVIEHLDHPEQALTEICRTLCPGGRLILIFPNDFMFMLARLMMGMFKEAFYDSGHVTQWTPRSIKKALTTCGLKLIGRRNLPFIFWPISLHHLVVAEKPVITE